MNITEIIQRRRAVYPNQYENAEIENSFIKLLLKNANTAPTHKLTQPWFFKAVSYTHLTLPTKRIV